nr:LysR family transcriptional regulator [Desulfobacterales bacterium]
MPSIDFDLRQLEIFCKVVELRSFSKAAEAVFLAQASVSERISNLEEAVGTRLLDRLGRTVVPTKAGEILYRHAIRLLEMRQKARLELEDFLGMKKGEIRIGGSTIPGEYILPGLIAQFHKKYPMVSVNLIIGDSKDIVQRVLDGDIELGIVGYKKSHPNLLYHALWDDELVLAIPNDHRWAQRPSVALDELLRERFILRETGSGTLKITEEFLGIQGINSLNVVARLGTSTAVKEGIKAGLGVSLISLWAVKAEVEKGILKALKIDGFPMHRSFYLLKHKKRSTSPLCQAMVDFLQATSEDKEGSRVGTKE